MKKIVIVGGGYGGLRAAEKLCANSEVSVTIIDKNHYHYLQTEMYEFVSGRLNICDISYNLNKFASKYENLTFIKDEAVEIADKSLICKEDNYPFDILIIAVGTKDFVPAKLQKYAYVIKNLSSAFHFKKEFMQKLFNEVTQQLQPHIVIGGAGQSGVELAADLVSYAQECNAEAGAERGVKVTLIEGGKSILPGAPLYIQKATHSRLQALGINIILNRFIEDIDDAKIYLKDENLNYDLFLFSGGTQSVSFVNNTKLKKDAHNLLLPNQCLQMQANIYAIGDCAFIADKNGKRLAPTAQIAEQSAEYVAHKILFGTKKPFRGKIYGMFTALGKHYAVGHIMQKIYFRGYFAYLLKFFITKLYAYGIKTKVNSAFFQRTKNS
jgi:NADH dehydrogenase